MFKINNRQQVSPLCHIAGIDLNIVDVPDQYPRQVLIADMRGDNLVIFLNLGT